VTPDDNSNTTMLKNCSRCDHPPVNRSQLFGRSWPLFGLHQNLVATSVRSTALNSTPFFVSTYLCEEVFFQMKIIKKDAETFRLLNI